MDTGTGILSIAAVKLGSRMVLALEVDSEAAKIAEENVYRNGLVGRVKIALKPLSEVEGPFDLIMANLTVAVVLHLANAISGRLVQDGFFNPFRPKNRACGFRN